MTQGIVSGASWFLVFLVIHILWLHWARVERCFDLIMKTFTGCLVGHLGTIVALNWGLRSIDQLIVRMCYGSLVMGCLFIVYMPFYYTIVTSLSVQTLICLDEAAGGSLRISALQQRFASAAIVAGRLKTMVDSGYLTEEAGRYRVTSKGHGIAHFFAYLKEIWKLGPGG
jgi:hypothetical protein